MTLHDRIKGALYGFALGDALGLGTEFMTREEIAGYYPDKCRRFSDIIRDAHRSQWQPGQWTNDTEFMICLCEQILDNGDFDVYEAAKYIKKTFDALSGDTSPVLRAVMNNPGWVENPILKTHETWQRQKLSEASNEAIQRGIVSGLLCSREQLGQTTRRMVLLTNDDSRCVSSTMVIAYMTHCLLHTGEPAPFDDLTAICYAADARTIPFLEATLHEDINTIGIDDEDTMMYTRKSMAAGLWPVWHCQKAEDYIYSIIDQGGDADTNAAISGAFAGLRFGFDALPDIKEEIIDKERLDILADRITDYVRKNIMR